VKLKQVFEMTHPTQRKPEIQKTEGEATEEELLLPWMRRKLKRVKSLLYQWEDIILFSSIGILKGEVLIMAMVKKSITVTDRQDVWIKAQIKIGHFGNESEVVRELIRERQLCEERAVNDIEIIRMKLIKAEASGFTDQSPEEVLKEIKNGLGRNAGL